MVSQEPADFTKAGARFLSLVLNPFVCGSDGIYRCSGFQTFDWQSHGFGTRDGSPVADVTLRQVHSATVLNAAGLSDRGAEGDGLITDLPGVAVGIRTADCVPILMLDSQARAVAAVHAGWRGTAAGIIEECVRRMRSEFSTVPENIYAALGPSIGACCYQVGMDVAERFRKWDAVRPGNHVDLGKANRLQLQAAGVPIEQIFDAGLCTFCHPGRFHSFRRDPNDPGRMISAISRQT